MKPLLICLFLLSQCTAKLSKQAYFAGKSFTEAPPDVLSLVGDKILAQLRWEYTFGTDTTGEIRLINGAKIGAVVPFSWHIVGDSMRLSINKSPARSMYIEKYPNGFTLKSHTGSIGLTNQR